jgi:hypothetical protein
VRPPPADEVSGIDRFLPSCAATHLARRLKDGVVIDMAMPPPLLGGDWSEGECAHRRKTNMIAFQRWQSILLTARLP